MNEIILTSPIPVAATAESMVSWIGPKWFTINSDREFGPIGDIIKSIVATTGTEIMKSTVNFIRDPIKKLEASMQQQIDNGRNVIFLCAHGLNLL